MATWEEFKQCIKIEANLDFEAIDVAFIQPLKDLEAWWQRQSDATKRFITFFTTGIGGAALSKFLARIFQRTSAAVAAEAGVAFGAVLAGAGLGLSIAAMVSCGLREVEIPSV